MFRNFFKNTIIVRSKRSAIIARYLNRPFIIAVDCAKCRRVIYDIFLEVVK